MSRMTDTQEDMRAAIEDAQFLLSAIPLSIRQIERRIQLALEEGAREKLLSPCFDELNAIALRVSRAAGAMTEASHSEVWMKTDAPDHRIEG